MRIGEIENVEDLLSHIQYFFGYVDVERERLEKELRIKQDEQEDLLHEIELASLNVVERGKVFSKLENVRKERRKLKDSLEYISTLKGYTNKFITKGICAETAQALKNIDTLKRNQQERVYKPRVLKDLKCAKKSKEEK